MKKQVENYEIILNESEKAIRNLIKIYEDFDKMNGHLHELSEILDEEKYSFFFSIWNNFPTYQTFDDLKSTLEDIQEDLIEEKFEFSKMTLQELREEEKKFQIAFHYNNTRGHSESVDEVSNILFRIRELIREKSK